MFRPIRHPLLLLAVAAGPCVATALPAAGQTRVFLTRPEWQAALNGSPRSQEDFNAIQPQPIPANAATAVGGLSITHHQGTDGSADIAPGDAAGHVDGTPWFRGYTGAVPAASWTFVLPRAVTAYGADYCSPASGSGVVLVINGETHKFSHIGGGRGFVGVITDAPFTTVRYERDADAIIAAEIWAVDNITFADTSAAYCAADFNRSGEVTVQDVFDFLVAYFAGAPAADINGRDGVTVQDVFEFLITYFGGCP